MAGYSGTPLAKKLGLKSELRISLLGIPEDVEAELKDSLDSCTQTAAAPLDFAMLFTTSQAHLEKHFPKLSARLAPTGMLWISWPKKTSGTLTDLNENIVREIGLGFGLVDVKVCAVNEIWSGLKFVIRVKDRKPPGDGLNAR